MINYLVGKMKEDDILLTSTGVGYEVSTIGTLAGKVELFIHTVMRENEIKLYGFTNLDEKKLFIALIKINKVGPNMALGILRSLGYSETLSALLAKDVDRLAKSKGVGKQMASTIVNSIKVPLDISAKVEDNDSGAKYDAIETLLALGFSLEEAHLSVKNTLVELGDSLDLTLDTAESVIVAQSLRSMK